MLRNGFIKDHRALLAWGWFKEPYTAHLWEYLRLAANWEAGVFKGRPVARGQLVTSYPSMAEATGLTIQNVRTAVRHLKKTGEITMQSYRDYSVITIVNYEMYQSEQQPGQQPGHRQLTGGQQASNSQPTTNEKSKKAKRQESKKESPPHSPPAELEGRFTGDLLETVWDWIAYKQERREAYKPTGLKNLLAEIERREAQAGPEAVIAVIRLSMANGWRGIIWDRMAGEAPRAAVQGGSFADVAGDW